MRTTTISILLITIATAAATDDRVGGFEDLLTSSAWTAQPGWLSNPSPSAAASRDGAAAIFRVDEPHKGMKWSAPVQRLWLRDFPFLVLRYRAANFNTAFGDYAVYLDDGNHKRQLTAVRPADLIADDQWHTLAVDVSALTDAETILNLAVQVQAGPAGKGTLRIDRLEFADAPPPDAKLLNPPAGPARPEQVIPLTPLTWTAQPKWLGNPANAGQYSPPWIAELTRPATTPTTATAPAPPPASCVFRVKPAGAGMKWSAPLGQTVPLTGHRYLLLRYRCRDLAGHGDYLLCGLGKAPAGQSTYVPLVSPGAVRSDGRWHTAAVELRPILAKLTDISGLACQVQARSADAWLELGEIRLTDALPAVAASDFCEVSAQTKWAGFAPVPLGPAANAPLKSWLDRLRLTGWPDGEAATFQSVPFDFRSAGGKLAATRLAQREAISVPANARASEVYLLLLGLMVGPEESVFGPGQLNQLRDVDRFRVRLEYADGPADECLPFSAATNEFGVTQGLQVLVASADPARPLRRITVHDGSAQAAFAVAAVTVRIADRLFPAALDETPPLLHRPPPPAARTAATFKCTGPLCVIADGEMKAEVSLASPPRILRLRHLPSGRDLLARPIDLVQLSLDGKAVPSEDLLPAKIAFGRPNEIPRAFSVRGRERILLETRVTPRPAGGLAISGSLVNRSAQPCRAALTVRVGPYHLADRPEDEFYLMPKRGAAFDNRPCSYRERYCGTFPVQFVDTFAPAAGCGLYLRTECAEPAPRHYLLEKTAAGLTVGLEHAEAVVAPNGRHDWPAAIIRLTDGQWRRGLEDYTAWRATLPAPASPRKPWFREIFNFRQRFLHGLDPLYDRQAGRIDLQRAVDEARTHFGGIDYLHLFDWGDLPPYGRIYGRTGDYSPYDNLPGGRQGLHDAIASVRKQGVPVGLYIEGYLLEEKGKLGRQFGQLWQMIGPDGQGRYWPACSEMYMCAAVKAWQDVQRTTYAAKVSELDVDGMYLDEFGFAGEYVDCWSKDHGHAVPSYSAATERECTKLVREAIDAAKKNVALYTEETPIDLTVPHQDGSFTYAMASARVTASQVPLNAARFAFPDFKTIEILICDKPTASWATGVKWVFFNGEAIWLEGSATQWFEPQTLDAIRRCYAILHEHRDAFTTLRPVPLVQTLAGGVFANAFPADGKTVYTFYNSRRRTFRGDVLSVPWQDGATYRDVWNNQPASVRRDGGQAIIRLEIGPQDVGCVVVAGTKKK